MKILILSDSYPPEIGGGGQIVKNIASALVGKNIEVRVLSAVGDLTRAGQNLDAGVWIKRILRDNRIDRFYSNYLTIYNPKAIAALRTEISNFRPDIVHAHNINWYWSYYALKAAKKSGAKVFFTAHDVMSFNYRKLDGRLDCNYKVSWQNQLRQEKFGYFPLRNFLIRYYLNNYPDQIVAVSEALKNAFCQNRILNVKVIHNGVDIPFWQGIKANKKRGFIQKYHLSGKKVIFFGGRLSVGKGIIPLATAFKRVNTTFPNSRLIVVGDTEGLELGENVISLRVMPQEDLRTVYHCCDLFISPSTCFDSFPTMNLEAMACSKPVITTIFGGSKELVVNGITGFLVNPLDIGSLSDQILEVLSSSGKAKSMGNAGFKRIKDFFSVDVQVAKYLSLYNGGRI